jgi:CheY-like chemotaxis protein
VKTPTILVVEDNELTMELVADLLEAAGLRVEKAKVAEKGIALVLEHRPDLVLMDLALPGLDGLEATRRLKSDPATASIPVVALTAQVMSADVERARAAGCEGFLAKPIDTRGFVPAIRRLLKERGKRRPAARPLRRHRA